MRLLDFKPLPLMLSLIAVPGLAQDLTPTSAAPEEVVFVTEDLLVPVNVHGVPQSAERDTRIRDEAGDVHYLIDLRAGAEAAFAKLAPPMDGFASWQKSPARHLVRELERAHGLRATSMTSWAGLGFTAFLTPDQVKALSEDPRVERLTPDTELPLSGPLWTDSTSGGETKSWGKRAVAWSTPVSGGGVRVYVLDTGIGHHEDLNVVQRVWPLGNNAPEGTVGCYPHSNHVAGIIGARQNAKGTVGISPGAALVSVSVLGTGNLDAVNGCNRGGSNGGSTAAGFIAALDWVMMDITQRGRVGIVNLSFNAGSSADNIFAATGTAGSRMKVVAKSVGTYKGAFISQSAGNSFQNACGYAYGPASFTDGIMVTGALDDRGQPLTPMHCDTWPTGTCIGGIRNLSTVAQSQPGSNYGACVEAWAPGYKIASTFGTYPQSGTAESTLYAPMSGTSMAAPFVAGLAAHLAESLGLTTPLDIELAVRNKLYPLQSKDHVNQNISLPTLNPPGNGQGHAFARAEFAIRQRITPRVFFLEHVGATLQLPTTGRFNLSFDSVGAPASGCVITRYNYATPAYPMPTPFATTVRDIWMDQYLPPVGGPPVTYISYKFFASCDSDASAGLFVAP